MFYSTRDTKNKLKASEAIIKGLASDGGLFFPEEIPHIAIDEKMLNASYIDLGLMILAKYLDDFSEEEIKDCLNKAYNITNFKEKIFGLSSYNNYSFLELFYGPTLTFKDMALTLLPHLMEVSLRKNHIDSPITILSATSGDTGSAALSGFKSSALRVRVLYPYQGVSEVQERQMLYFSSHKDQAYTLKNSNFDDCQRLIKEALNRKSEEGLYTSANSINIGRLLPQIIYYYAAYISLVKENRIKLGERINVIVPTGNFGDIFSGYLAKRMGLPINKLVISTNENKILDDFLKTGIYDINRIFHKTNSPAMDILISSNLERLLFDLIRDDKRISVLMKDLREKKVFKLNKDEKNKLNDFLSASINEEETIEAIRSCYQENKYIIDPHTGVAYASYRYLLDKLDNCHSLIISTASPLKFPSTIISAIEGGNMEETAALKKLVDDYHLSIPYYLKRALDSPFKAKIVTKNSFLKEIAYHKKFDISVSSSSANLGPGFDAIGLALDLTNVFRFETSEKDELINFDDYIEDNLVLKSYQHFFKSLNLNYKPIKITKLRQDIPIARGLGSSASCIVAGILAANHLFNDFLSEEEIIKLSTEIEGHSDNVTPVVLGGLASACTVNNLIKTFTYPLSKKLKFVLVIPPYELSTKRAREILPKDYKKEDVIYTTAHSINLTEAYRRGDISLLKEMVEDKIHSPYRLPLIPDGETVKKFALKHDIAFAISGSGSSMLLISDKLDFLEDLKKVVCNCQVLVLKPGGKPKIEDR